VLCTVRLSRKLFPEHKRHNLDSLIERHGLKADARHRALADAQLIHQFWQRIHDAPGSEAVQEALLALNDYPYLPSHLADAGITDDLPEEPGVYLFYGESPRPLYEGKAKNLKKRVLSHFSRGLGSAEKADLARQVLRIEWTEFGTPVRPR
jgi:DNA polymerase-3 subunit epsilon